MSNDYMADLCDKLLGVDRNDPLTMKITKKIKFSDHEVCKPYLVGFCPHLTFSNTKSDVGPCPRKVHEDSIREQFLAEGERYREDYEIEFFGILHRMVQDLQRKIRKAQSRLEAKPSNEVEHLLNPEKDEFEERRAILDVQMRNLIKKMEEAAEHGKMKEVQEINVQLEILRAEMSRIAMAEESNPLVKQDKKMEVCQVCGSLLVMNDLQKRLEAHFEGKQHVGFQKVWEFFELYKKKFPDVYRRLECSGKRPYSSYKSHFSSLNEQPAYRNEDKYSKESRNASRDSSGYSYGNRRDSSRHNYDVKSYSTRRSSSRESKRERSDDYGKHSQYRNHSRY